MVSILMNVVKNEAKLQTDIWHMSTKCRLAKVCYSSKLTQLFNNLKTC